MGAGAVSGHQKESSGNQQDTPSFTTSNVTSQSSENTSTTSVTGERANQNQDSVMKISCEMCSSNFTFFKRKKFCQECHRYFCSTCLPKPPQTKSRTGRQCNKCQLLMSGQFSRNDLLDWKVKDIRCFLKVRKISMIGCREKHDLIELVLTHFCTKRRNSMQDQAEHEVLVQSMAARMQNEDSGSLGEPAEPSETAEAESASEPKPNSQTEDVPSQDGDGGGGAGPDEDEASFLHDQWQELFDSMERIQETFARHTLNQRDHHASAPEIHTSASPRQRCHLDDIHTVEDIEALSVRQIKELLVNNFVDFKGCCEKQELVTRVRRLWQDHQINKSKAEKIHLRDEAEAVARSNPSPPANPATKPTDSTAPSDNESHAPTPAASTPAGQQGQEPEKQPQPNDSLCRVCMDALTDCILLECGHMVTCATCGKQLAECPICRQYIVRVVRVFRS